MEKDLFDYVVIPTKKELRKHNCIDQMYNLPNLIIPKNGWQFWNKDHYYDYLVKESIINYNNEIVIAKYYYCSAIKYDEYFLKTNDNNYDFWSRKYLEQTFKELFSIYDKSMLVINYLYDLQILPDGNFKKNVREKLKLSDKDIYKKINKIYSKLYGDKTKSMIRDNITHNSSELFDRYIPIYEDGKTSWQRLDAIEYDEIINMIESICNLLGENKEIINEALHKKYRHTD